MIKFQRITNSAFLEPKTGTTAPDAVTTPDVLKHGKEMYLFVGAVAGEQERIICQEFPIDALKTGSPTCISTGARVVIAPGPHLFDNRHVFDPAAISVDGDVFLFYSAIGEGKDSIGLAVSNNGKNFTKKMAPILTGRSPEVCLHEGKLFLFYVKKSPQQGYRIFSAVLSLSGDVDQVITEPVLSIGKSGSWDQYEVTTPRLFERKGIFYMLYAGNNDQSRKDTPIGFGMARSTDLMHWEKYPHNPVFKLGSQGNWDDGALWFGTLFESGETIYLIYEGGRLENISDHSPAITKVGLAAIDSKDFDLKIGEWI